MFLPTIKLPSNLSLFLAACLALNPAFALAQDVGNPKLSFQNPDFSDHLFLELRTGEANNTMAYHGLSGNDQSAFSITPRRLGRHQEGDISVPADYTGDGVTNMAVVSIEPFGAGKRLNWTIHDGSRKLEPISFGSSGATVIGGCDFTGDNKAELAFVKGRTFRFRGLDENDPKASFRLSGGKHIAFFCADTTGDGKDELIALSHNKNNDQRRFFNVWGSDGEHLIERAKFGHPRKTNVIAADINGDGKANIGFFRNIPGGSRLTFLTDSEGNQIEEIDLIERIKLPAGNYELTRGMHITQSSGFAEGLTFAAPGGRYFKFNFEDMSLLALDTSNLLANSSSKLVLVRDVNAIATESKNGLAAVCPNIIPVGPTGFLNKPQAEHTNDQRTGRPVYLWTSNKPGLSNVDIYASNGTKISQASRYFAGTTKYGDRFYACWGGSPCHTGSQMATLAQSAAGKGDVYIQGKPGYCHGPFNPAQRSGAIHK